MPTALSAPVIAREPLSQALIDELAPLLTAHWQEIALDRDIPLDPDWLRYASLNAGGKLRVWSARCDGALMAYLCCIVDTHLHYRHTLVAHQDVLYARPDARGAAIGRLLVRHAEQALKAEGVQIIFQHSKADPALSIAPWLKRQGYREHDVVLSKRL